MYIQVFGTEHSHFTTLGETPPITRHNCVFFGGTFRHTHNLLKLQFFQHAPSAYILKYPQFEYFYSILVVCENYSAIR